MTTVLIGGVVANKHLQGGAVWTRLNWVLGFKKLGFDVHLVEQIDRSTCVDAAGMVTDFETSENLAYFKRVVEQFGLDGASSLLYAGGERSHGLTWEALLDLAASAALVVNIAGHLTARPILDLPRCKVYVDLDPGYLQIWHGSGEVDAQLDRYDFHFTVGENVGVPGCSIPTGDVRWRPVRQPVVLEHWPVSTEGRRDRFTTVASWRGPYGPVNHGGRTLGSKVHEFRRFIELPSRTQRTFELALDIHPAETADLDLLGRHGWRIVDPKAIVHDPTTFRRYVQTSGAEFSVAQGMYVHTRSGWFSDRTVRYLASGKPALVQDTGFGRNFPIGEGLLAFRTLEEAVSGAEQIVRDYDRHARAARSLAETYFDSDRVLSRLLEEVGVAP